MWLLWTNTKGNDYFRHGSMQQSSLLFWCNNIRLQRNYRNAVNLIMLYCSKQRAGFCWFHVDSMSNRTILTFDASDRKAVWLCGTYGAKHSLIWLNIEQWCFHENKSLECFNIFQHFFSFWKFWRGGLLTSLCDPSHNVTSNVRNGCYICNSKTNLIWQHNSF